MQKQMSCTPAQVARQTVAIRIGCNSGPWSLKTAISRIAVTRRTSRPAKAKAGQIITRRPWERLSSDWRASAAQIDIATLKGRSSEVALFECFADETSPEWCRDRDHLARTGNERIDSAASLRYQGQEVLVTTAAPYHHRPAEENDLVVKGI